MFYKTIEIKLTTTNKKFYTNKYRKSTTQKRYNLYRIIKN
jgi:hypothetical protein